MTDHHGSTPASSFIERWIARVAVGPGPHGRALDLACGRGRHTLLLARAGFHAIGLDIRRDALDSVRQAASSRGLRVALACVDVTHHPLPPDTFGVVVVTRFLDRALVPQIIRSLAAGGVLLYETFTERQLAHARGPRSRAHLLRPGELRTLVHGMDVLFDEEVEGPDAVARIAAQRRPVLSRAGA